MKTRRTQRILVVDDNRDITETLSWGLEYLGYTVRTASCGRSGLEAALEFRPEAALIDLTLPVMDGWALAEHFADHPMLARPRLIAMTGHSPLPHRRGFDHHLVKPVSLSKIDALLSS